MTSRNDVRGVLTSAPWRRAPWLLARQSPVSFVACALAMVVLAAAAASGPLFLASTATAALHNEVSLNCPEAAQPSLTDDLGPDHYPSSTERGGQLAAVQARATRAIRARGLGTPYRVSTATAKAPGGSVSLFARRGAVRHVHVVASVGGSGVYVPASYASTHRLRPGSILPIDSRPVRVVGVYRDLAPSAFVPLFELPRYWCTWRDDIVPTPFNRPLPLLLTDDRTISASRVVSSTWYDATPTSGRTIGETRTAAMAMERAYDSLSGAKFVLSSQADYLLAKADRMRAGVRGPVVPIVLASVIVAALLVGASGAFWCTRRARELTLLQSRGVGRGLLAFKAVLENLPAVLVGTALGWAGALVFVIGLGPASRLESDAPWSALAVAGSAGAAALVLLAGVVWRTLPADRAVPRTRAWRAVPWEGLLLIAAALAYLSVRREGAVHVVRATLQINPAVVTFPLLALTGLLLVLGRGASHGIRRLARPTRRWPAAGYLAARRVSGTPLVAVGALIGTALPVAVLVYGSSFTGSVDDTVTAKYRTDHGAPYAVGLLTHGNPARTDGHGTVVSLIDADSGTAVLAIDPASFDRFAYGNVQDRIAPITRPGGRTPALLVNASSSEVVSSVRVHGTRIGVDVVARSAVFPGLRNAYEPMLVIDRARLPQLDPNTERKEELWTTPTQLRPALAALARTGVEANYEITTAAFLDSTGLRPITWVFGYLDAIAALTGLIALAGLGLAFAVRTRRRAFAYHLARRMGLSRASHRRSLAIELGALLGLAWGTGVSVAIGVIAVTFRLTDPYPNAPPPPAFPGVGVPVVATGVAVVLVAAVAVLLIQRQLDRTHPAALLR